MNILPQIQTLGILSLIGLMGATASAQTGTSEKPPNFVVPSEPPPPLSQEILDSQPKEIPPDPPDFTDIREKLLLLHQFLSLPHDRLVRIRATIEMIEKMTEDERERLRVRLSKMQDESKELEKEMNEFSKGLSSQERIIANKYWLSQRESQRDTFRKKWKQLADPKKQLEFLKEEIAAFEERQQQLINQLPTE